MMWPWVDQPSLPSSNEVITIKKKIFVLESKMNEELELIAFSQHRLAKLRREWEERKASIAPINSANFDVLSLIFELCGEIDSKAPLQIGRVSRYWRAVVLRTPRAWCFLDANSGDNAYCEAYCERSGDQDLHVNLPIATEIACITSTAHRIRCMTIADYSSPNSCIHAAVFPRLTRLVLPRDSQCCLDPCSITTSCFPNLCHMDLRCILYAVDTCPELPPLKSLTITVYDEDGWPSVMKACNTTLKSLIITIEVAVEPWMLEIIEYIRLPELLYLKIVDQAESLRPWWQKWDAPILETFIEYYGRHIADSWTQGPEYTTGHMRLNRPPSLSDTSKIRVLQIDMTFEHFCHFFDVLRVNASKCPQLEYLELGHSQMNESEILLFAIELAVLCLPPMTATGLSRSPMLAVC